MAIYRTPQDVSEALAVQVEGLAADLAELPEEARADWLRYLREQLELALQARAEAERQGVG